MKRLPSSPASSERVTDTNDVRYQGWRTIKELTEYMRFPTTEVCRLWLKREKVPYVRRTRVILVHSIDVDRALRGLKRRA